MDKLIEWMMTSVLEQGFSITLLFVAIVYFYREQKVQREEIKSAQVNLVKYLTDDRSNLIKLIEEMGDILQQNTQILRQIERKL